MAFPLSDAEHAAIRARIDGQAELIVAAAIEVEGVVVMAARPGRHADCINFIHNRAPGVDYKSRQGFVTNRGRFVDRREAALIVEASGQGSTRDMGPGYPRALFSEDMWNDWADESERQAYLATAPGARTA